LFRFDRFSLAIQVKLRLEAENAVLRHQLNVMRRRLPGRVRLTNHDRWFLIQLYRWFPSILQVLTIIRPETLVRWHRAGFRCYWRWKSLPLGGRPQIETKLRALIRRMSAEKSALGWRSTARLWDAETGQPIGVPFAGHRGRVWSAVFSHDGKRVITVSDDKTARL
jgi:hypothetical protein